MVSMISIMLNTLDETEESFESAFITLARIECCCKEYAQDCQNVRETLAKKISKEWQSPYTSNWSFEVEKACKRLSCFHLQPDIYAFDLKYIHIFAYTCWQSDHMDFEGYNEDNQEWWAYLQKVIVNTDVVKCLIKFVVFLSKWNKATDELKRLSVESLYFCIDFMTQTDQQHFSEWIFYFHKLVGQHNTSPIHLLASFNTAFCNSEGLQRLAMLVWHIADRQNRALRFKRADFYELGFHTGHARDCQFWFQIDYSVLIMNGHLDFLIGLAVTNRNNIASRLLRMARDRSHQRAGDILTKKLNHAQELYDTTNDLPKHSDSTDTCHSGTTMLFR